MMAEISPTWAKAGAQHRAAPTKVLPLDDLRNWAPASAGVEVSAASGS